jgi:predicted SAM-dependent methyltransferase
MKLHLGCGARHIPGFIHVDLADYPHIDYRQDVRRLPMFGDGTATLIYASHVLPYFDRTEVVSVLGEWRRVLSCGGVLRLAVPDFEALVGVYQRTSNLSLIHGPLYGRWPVESGRGAANPVLYHRTVYDFVTLRTVLESAGYTKVRRFEWRDTEHAAVDDFSQAYIPHLDKAHGALVSLNVECQKP